MRAGSDFGHHAAIKCVVLGLAGDMFSQHIRPAIFEAHDSRRGFIAAGFDPEDGDRAL
jgi:hypothetical protein